MRTLQIGVADVDALQALLDAIEDHDDRMPTLEAVCCGSELPEVAPYERARVAAIVDRLRRQECGMLREAG